ncbi:MAG: ATP-binding cassette domain-containing protein, partial [Candidatus Promineifilaceae bacterium]
MENEKKPLLSIQDLKTYFVMDEGTSMAVDGVSFDVYPGQVVGVVGESGCGKSVTIKSVLQIVPKPGEIVGGDIFWRWEEGQENGNEGVTNIVTLDPHGRKMRSIRGAEIALIPQEPMAAFSPVHTVGSQIVEAIRLHMDVSKKEAEKIAIERLHEVGMPSPEQRMDAYSWELSGG